MAIKPFDAAHSELRDGFNLIEASAGTGKTYTLSPCWLYGSWLKSRWISRVCWW